MERGEREKERERAEKRSEWSVRTRVLFRNKVEASDGYERMCLRIVRLIE